MSELFVTVHTALPQGVFTRFMRENPETAMQEFRELFAYVIVNGVNNDNCFCE